MVELTNDNYLRTLNFIENHSIQIHTLNLLIVFTIGDRILQYTLASHYLRNLNGDNGRIFTELNLDKYKFCESVYGYKPQHGDFPECRLNTNECLMKIIKALFDECCNSTVPIEKLSITSIKTSFVDKIEEVPSISSTIKLDDIPF